ncbi:MAG: PhzF family phenazine biosynthesis protein [Verrucomicrobiales bacterium]|nr:PhzF family phenazine biosynthesis protein [Verrucomicrobiales bacterium]
MSTRFSHYSIYQVDAFADAVFKGNPAAIVPLDTWLPDAVMQKIAMENQLSETAFFVQVGSGFDLRWFTPFFEVDLCGHATLAAAHVLFSELHLDGGEVVFKTKSGELKVERDNGAYRMNFPIDRLSPLSDDRVEVALGVPPMALFQGKDDLLAVLECEKAVRELEPDMRRIAELDARGVIVTARAGRAEQLDFVSRCFFPKYGIDEDPVTGSAHTTMAPYWSEKLNKSTLRAAQRSPRGGSVGCEVLGDRVILSGGAVTFLRGEISLPLVAG